MSNTRDSYKEVRHQMIKEARIFGCIKDITWNNKHLTSKSTMTYVAETQVDTSKTK